MEYISFIFSSFITLLINNFKKFNHNDVKTILLIRLDHIGDMMLTFNAMGNLRRQYEKANIIMITGEWNKDLFVNSPLVDSVILYNSPAFSRNKNHITSVSDRIRILNNIKSSKVDLLIGFRDDLFTCLLALFLYPHLRNDRGTIRLKMKLGNIISGFQKKGNKVSLHEIDTNKKIIAPFLTSHKDILDYFPSMKEEKLWLSQFFLKHNISKGNYAIMHPGASWKYKRWKAENFRVIGKYLYDTFKLRTILIGTADEIELGEKICQGDKEIFINIIGQCSLRESILLIADSKIAVCNDSGPMHIAAQSKIPTIGLMGSSDIDKFGPVGGNVLLFHKKLECYPCAQVICKYPSLPCVDLNTPEEIIMGIRHFLDPVTK
jgi:ADP-heptose:LPS heptosyltransferase